MCVCLFLTLSHLNYLNDHQEILHTLCQDYRKDQRIVTDPQGYKNNFSTNNTYINATEVCNDFKLSCINDIRLCRLLRKISSMYLSNSHMITSISMSSIASNGDSHSLSNYDYNWQDLRDGLKNQFLEQPIKEALLVMDEVNDRKCVEAFDVGCKILITTRDTDVVADYHPTIINVSIFNVYSVSFRITSVSCKLPTQSVDF